MSNNNLSLANQLLRWFEKMKTNYENNIKQVLNQFEANQEKQQTRLDKSHDAHIASLTQSYQQQIADKNKHIAQLESQIQFYQQQLIQQQKNAEQLNTRYDTVVTCMLTEKRRDFNIRDIFDDDEFTVFEPTTSKLSVAEPTLQPTQQTPSNQEQEADEQLSIEQIYQQGVELRQQGQYSAAFELFQQAAETQLPQAMGALGRAYFLSEGVEENYPLGLAWLINAANLAFSPAQTKVDQFKENDPELYQQALELAEQLL
ncbi:sel1 repeat family protein [Endozoicomonas sp. G2_1]|uniref:sel1 repeat family protein n=1 Tax=Endozoicomonas sp. G2_1 TaxID=2821091 RepID=UPI001ADB5E2F|nr:sel1 repeat family protein [Endozoicomonas sp. G2_1]MBO9491303.1 sel1 repeat family protein [Endozoicomonas sp. G2_1]